MPPILTAEPECSGAASSPGASHDYVPYAYDVTAASPDAVITALSPVGYWKCDDASGAPQDSSGNGNHATAAHATVTYSQAPLSAKVGNSIRLSASGGRLHFPSLGVATCMSDVDEAWTLVGLFMFESDGLPSTNGVVWLTESQANTAGIFINYLSSGSIIQYVNNGGNQSVMSPDFFGGLNVPFCYAMRKSGSELRTHINGVLVATTFCVDDNAVGVGFDIGMNFGDSFFNSPQLRVSNVAGWSTALTDAQFGAVIESLMDDSMMAAANVLYP